MTTIRFGKSCDGPGCKTYYNNYDTGDIVPCDHCGLDLCAPCVKSTGHRMLREDVCCYECPGPAATCEVA